MRISINGVKWIIGIVIFILFIFIIFYRSNLNKEDSKEKKREFYELYLNNEIKNVEIGGGYNIVTLYEGYSTKKIDISFLNTMNKNKVDFYNVANKGDSLIKEKNSYTVNLITKKGEKYIYYCY